MASSQTETRENIHPNVLTLIGNTPMVKINRISKHLDCELVAKCEFFNPAGSVKDRIAYRMIKEKLSSGELSENGTIIEATSGNTGLGVSLVGAVLGIKTLVTLSSKNSEEKIKLLKAFNTETVVLPFDVAHDSEEDYINVAKRIHKERHNSVLLNQYSNDFNPREHYDVTAEEIIEQCGGKVDMIVIGSGTGGTITGISKKIREKLPNCLIVGVDPEGSLMANDSDPVGPYLVEGIGYDFLPKVFERSSADFWVKTNDKESFLMARRLISEEGILAGASSGSALCGALQAAKTLRKGQRCVVILPDSVRNYMSKFVDDNWMMRNGITQLPPDKLRQTPLKADLKISAVEIQNDSSVDIKVSPEKLSRYVIEEGIDCVAVSDGDENAIVGVVEREQITSSKGEPLCDLLQKDFVKVHLKDSLDQLINQLRNHKFAVVFSARKSVDGLHDDFSDCLKRCDVFVGILQRRDVIKFI